MDPREPQQLPASPHLPPHHHHHHHHLHHQSPHHQHQQHMISPYPSSMINQNTNPNNAIPNPNSASSGFPFNSVGPPLPRPQPKPADGGFDGSSPPSSGTGFNTELSKKKRGRPRKYTPEGNIALALSPTTISSSGKAASSGYGDSGGGGGNPVGGGTSSEQPAKRNRGRPPGSGKKQLDALGGVGGIGFTPHVITVKAGEDIATKITSFSQQGPRSVCILSANGAVSNVSLRQAATSSGTVTYDVMQSSRFIWLVCATQIYASEAFASGIFEIISLSGSYLTSDDNSSPKTAGALSVSLAGADGRVLGGRVAGSLMAATAVQVIVGSFVADGKKSSSHISKSGPLPLPGAQMLNFAAPLTASTPSQGASSETSDDSGSSPLNRGPGIYGNSGQPIHGVHMYQLWAGQNPQ